MVMVMMTIVAMAMVTMAMVMMTMVLTMKKSSLCFDGDDKWSDTNYPFDVDDEDVDGDDDDGDDEVGGDDNVDNDDGGDENSDDGDVEITLLMAMMNNLVFHSAFCNLDVDEDNEDQDDYDEYDDNDLPHKVLSNLAVRLLFHDLSHFSDFYPSSLQRKLCKNLG